mmetsp:Transcript_5288/g.14965  ORF Transcript_5288/g.14965 Transcript_5288/m.14965 type:complete len:118 (-) Transcript_5288:22-375(-)
MGVAAALAKLPGACVLLPPELAALSQAECQQRLGAEGVSVEGLSESDVRMRLEEVLNRRYCALFAQATLAGLVAWLLASCALSSEAAAISALALPGPLILLGGGGTSWAFPRRLCRA